MKFELRTGSNGRKVFIWAENEVEKQILGSFTGITKVELAHIHTTRGKVDRVIIHFEDPQETEPE